MPLTQHLYAFTHDELEALRRLQEQSPAPSAEEPEWSHLLSIGFVWLDASTQPSTYRLTSAGRGYATEY